ncbi:response regulator transcription factor [Moritella sp. 24]|uniref:response regulator transcription factor n=1 Tax=Moritella sp. 24 TaxID=2746230 RepID=UPI001BA9497E|nr:response regulator transcription factor [Moritella sp. 24]QUM74870.1 response regulator transcription factor [Moritella sp. 24]
MKVLIVDDNYNIAETIADYLSLTDITVDFAYNGLAAIKLLESERFDVIIMDIMMPKFDGIATVTKLRDELRCDTPILFLTAKDSLADKVAAFKAGGDDYLLKPFAMEELLLRVQALSSRGARQDIAELTFADITVDSKSERVTRAGYVVKLSRIQFKILHLLVKKAPQIVTREEVISSIWGDQPPSSDALRSHIYSLRNALNRGFTDSRLETVHGQGYRIKN